MSKTTIGDVDVLAACKCIASYHWEIKNFWICCSKAGDMLVSPKFIAAHDSNPFMWNQLIFYPKGKTEEVKDCFSLFMKIITRSANADMKEVSLSIFNDNFELITRTFYEPTQKDPTLWGSQNFVYRNIIKTKAMKSRTGSDNLSIVLRIISRKSEERTNVLQLRETNGTLNNDYKNFVDSETLSDVELLTGNKSLRAHKLILSKRSPVFAKILMDELQGERENKVEIEIPPFIRYEVVVEMLRYMYTEKVNNIDDIADELLVAANEYRISDLQIICEERLIKKLNIDNAIERLELAKSCDAELLKVRTIAFITEHSDDMIQKPEYMMLAPDIAHEIFTAHTNRFT